MLWKFKTKLFNDWHMRLFGWRDERDGWQKWCEGEYYDPKTHLLGSTPYSTPYIADTRWCKVFMTQKEMLTKVRER